MSERARERGIERGREGGREGREGGREGEREGREGVSERENEGRKELNSCLTMFCCFLFLLLLSVCATSLRHRRNGLTTTPIGAIQFPDP